MLIALQMQHAMHDEVRMVRLDDLRWATASSATTDAQMTRSPTVSGSVS